MEKRQLILGESKEMLLFNHKIYAMLILDFLESHDVYLH